MLKIRIVILIMVLMVAVTGCGSLLGKLTNKDNAQPTVTNNAATSGQDKTQSGPQEFSIAQIQTAIKDGKSVKVVAQDTGGSLVLDQTKRDELIKILADSGELKDTQELSLIVANPDFPAYQIQIEDQNLKVDVYDSVRFGVNTDNEHHVFMEKGDLVKNLKKWLPPRTYTSASLGYFFNASKVTVSGDTFTEETDCTPARNAILRAIRSVTLHSSTLPADAGEPLKVTFTVNEKNYSLKLYDDYLDFNHAVYKLPQGKKTIEGLLTAQ